MHHPLPLMAAACLALSAPGQAAPERVVSLNLCTDQLAMMLAAPGQLISVSHLARDPRSSAMAEEAMAYPVNHGLAEEIFLLQPDLVVAGQFTTQATVSMLERLDIPVVRIAPASALNEVSDRIAQMGHHLGREAQADHLITTFEDGLAALRDETADDASATRAAIYAANGYASGPATLAGDILNAAGFHNVAQDAGLRRGGSLPLEQLVMLDPDLVVLPAPWPGQSRSEAVLQHPALQALTQSAPTAPMNDHDWFCGTPYVLRAIEGLHAAHVALTREAP